MARPFVLMDGKFFQSGWWEFIQTTFMPWTLDKINLWSILQNWLFLTLLPAFIFWIIARVMSYRHARSLAVREAMTPRPHLTTLKHPPEGYGNPVIVSANVVISHSKTRVFAILWRRMIGGNIPILERMVNRARREAILRLEEEITARHADLLINLRFTSHNIGTGSGRSLGIEVVAYGTALQKRH
ncbi:YbjQ family protein [Iodidimonas muriae]|nr:heavy metal-binding domain-containing protein [Iodidimonas muriae]